MLHDYQQPAPGDQEARTASDGGSVRVFTQDFSVQFAAGAGDGFYRVTVGIEPRSCYRPGEGWRFVDSFTSRGSAYLSGADCEDVPAIALPPGRWFVWHLPDRRRVHIQAVPA